MLVREGHRGDLGAAPRPELLAPETPAIRFPLAPAEDGAGPLEQQTPQIGIAACAHASQGGFAAGPLVRRHQPEPRRTMPAVLAGPRIVDGGYEGGGGQGPHASDGDEPLTALGLGGQLDDACVVAGDLRIERPSPLLPVPEQLATEGTQPILRLFHDQRAGLAYAPNALGHDETIFPE